MDKYYNSLINIWDKGGGWGGCYYNVFSTIIKENDYKLCAEIGIGYGFHAKEILDNTNIDHLYLVDPSKDYKDSFADDVRNNGGFDALVSHIKDHLSEHKDRYTWYKKDSLNVTNDEINDGSMDAIFIDADHSYQAVKDDLSFWWKKLKVGGQLLGDDYWMVGVSRAVNEFATLHSLTFDFLYKPGTEYKIYRFHKTQ
jgi:predicted O-methyltransferase YrrM